MADLKNILDRFGFVTVMEPEFYAIAAGTTYAAPGALLFKIDSLRISNITQEGPTKEAKGGLYAEPLMRHGKTMRIEMEDVVGRIKVLQHLMGAKVTGTSKVAITDKFAKPVRVIGRTFVINANTGEKEWVTIHIPEFLPDSIFEQTMEAEGDFGAMNIGGQIFPNECGVFYEILLPRVADVPSCT